MQFTSSRPPSFFSNPVNGEFIEEVIGEEGAMHPDISNVYNALLFNLIVESSTRHELTTNTQRPEKGAAAMARTGIGRNTENDQVCFRNALEVGFPLNHS